MRDMVEFVMGGEHRLERREKKVNRERNRRQQISMGFEGGGKNRTKGDVVPILTKWSRK